MEENTVANFTGDRDLLTNQKKDHPSNVNVELVSLAESCIIGRGIFIR